MYITEAYTIVAGTMKLKTLPAHCTPDKFAEAKAVVTAHAEESPLYRRALRESAKMGR